MFLEPNVKYRRNLSAAENITFYKSKLQVYDAYSLQFCVKFYEEMLPSCNQQLNR